MQGPVVVRQVSGHLIAFEVFDVCSVEDTEKGVLIKYVPVDVVELILTSETFDEILEKLAVARRAALQNEGDEWKFNDDDDPY